MRDWTRLQRGISEESKLLEIAEQVLLPRDETELWFQHLKTVDENRQKGLAKAAATRKAKRWGTQPAQKEKSGRKKPAKG